MSGAERSDESVTRDIDENRSGYDERLVDGTVGESRNAVCCNLTSTRRTMESKPDLKGTITT